MTSSQTNMLYSQMRKEERETLETMLLGLEIAVRNGLIEEAKEIGHSIQAVKSRIFSKEYSRIDSFMAHVTLVQSAIDNGTEIPDPWVGITPILMRKCDRVEL
jgi:hypothetical protein